MITRNTHRWRMAALCGAALVAGAVFSQTSDGDPPENDIGGNDSPAGVTSGINGWVNTGCAYDSYTGNVRREVDEIVVPGCIGVYPLKWSRIYNSREAETTTALGVGWRHSYQYTMSLNTGDVVNFPDGREIDFNERSGIAERSAGPAWCSSQTVGSSSSRACLTTFPEVSTPGFGLRESWILMGKLQ